jgi:hypothetical protein
MTFSKGTNKNVYLRKNKKKKINSGFKSKVSGPAVFLKKKSHP